MELRISESSVEAQKGRTIAGYAAVFNSWSSELEGGFREKIAPGAFSRAVSGADVVALFNHDPSKILGRSRSGTLRLKQDSMGLAFSVDLPDTQLGREIYQLVKRRDIAGCSFGFTVRDDQWNTSRTERTLLDVDLRDVGPVTFPAYPETQVDVRRACRSVRSLGFYTSLAERNSKICAPSMTADQARAWARLWQLEAKC